MRWQYENTAAIIRKFTKHLLCLEFSSVIMGIITYIVYHGSYAVLKINAVSAMLAILAAVIVYAVVLLLLHGLTEEEIKKFPKGTLIVRVAKKITFIKVNGIKRNKMQMLLLEGDDMNQKTGICILFVWFCCWSFGIWYQKRGVENTKIPKNNMHPKPSTPF